MKKKDFIIILAVLVLILLSLSLRFFIKKGEKDRVIISYQNKKESYEIENEPKIIVIDQGNGKINKVYISKEEIYMLESSCKNQLCVKQGKMMPGKIKNRAMGNYIICLPHELTVELETKKEAFP